MTWNFSLKLSDSRDPYICIQIVYIRLFFKLGLSNKPLLSGKCNLIFFDTYIYRIVSNLVIFASILLFAFLKHITALDNKPMD